MDTATKALYISICAAVVAGVTLIITVWRFIYERPKLKLEIQKLKRDLGLVQTEVKDIKSQPDRILYDGYTRDIAKDFIGYPFTEWSNEKKDFLDVMGEGEHKLTGNIIDIRRKNTGGRYEMHLEHYEMPYPVRKIPVDPSISGKRKIKMKCEVKSVGGDHQLTFLFKADNQDVLDHKEYLVIDDKWTELEYEFSIRTDIPCFLRIDDQRVSKAPSSVQIKNLVLSEITNN